MQAIRERSAGAAEELGRVSRLIASSPALRAREAQILARYTDTLAGMIAEETGADRDDPARGSRRHGVCPFGRPVPEGFRVQD